ncbi:hypothetical protein DFH06DRAFT_1174857 [Mycena polygramma]|nr:hypothetical protein DFH06DRAFT_1174857 [Mycena polygramma]
MVRCGRLDWATRDWLLLCFVGSVFTERMSFAGSAQDTRIEERCTVHSALQFVPPDFSCIVRAEGKAQKRG